MTTIRLDVFSGERPRTSPRLLPKENAQKVRNSRLTNGSLEPLRGRTALTSVTTLPNTGAKSVFRLYDDAGEYWLGWDAVVHTVRAPLEGDTSFRFAFTGDTFEPRQSNLSMAVAGTKYPDSWYVLGVTAPPTAATVTSTGGTGTTEDRAYVYTYVTSWGEESAPSPASAIVTGKQDDTWTVSGMATAPPNTFTVTSASWASGKVTYTLDSVTALRVHETLTVTGCNPTSYNLSGGRITAISGNTVTLAMATDPGAFISGGTATRDAPHNTAGMKKRIYRSVTTGTDPNYYYVGEVDVATTTFTDTPTTTLGEPLPTSGWNMPPANMQGLHSLASGSVVGYAGNTVYISEPLAMYAYPASYQFVLNYPIVGIGTIGTAVVVVTEGFPYVINGLTPESMTMERVDNFWAGTSARGVVDTEYGVMWPTNQGLVLYGIDGADVITKQHYTQEEWEKLPHDKFIGAWHDHHYYGAYTDSDGQGRAFIFDTRNGGTASQADIVVYGLYSDPVTNKLYVMDNSGELAYWDATDAVELQQVWRSKRFVLPKPVNFAVAAVDATYTRDPAAQAAYDAAVAVQKAANESVFSSGQLGSSLNEAPFNAYSLGGSKIVPLDTVAGGSAKRVTFNLYVEDDLFFSKVVLNEDPFRLPDGKLYDEFFLEVIGATPIQQIAISTSVRELQRNA